MPKKLTGQIIFLILFVLISTHVFILSFYFKATDFHKLLYERINNGTYIDQMVSAVNSIESSVFRDQFSLNSFRVQFYVIDRPLFQSDNLSKKNIELTNKLKNKIGKDYPSASVQQLYEPKSRLYAALNHFSDYVKRTYSGKEAPYSPSVILQSQVQLKSGQWVVMLILDIYPYPEWIAGTLKPLLIFIVVFVIFSIIIVMGITSPLNELAKKANKLGIGEKIEAIKLRGPSDVQNVIVAFNDMLKRVTNVNDHRARALSAISHDIRTPLTSMRLQAEFIEEKDVQENIFKKIDEMEEICEATITFALQDSWTEKTREFDISSLVDSLCSDLHDQGFNVDFNFIEKINFYGRPITLKRAITNLIKNGVEYGKKVDVFIKKSDDFLEIHIIDHGKGIPEEKIEMLFAPFERLEHSRNRDSGGLGLGLAIARSVVRSHGGEIQLSNIDGKGLDATIILPMSPHLID